LIAIIRSAKLFVLTSLADEINQWLRTLGAVSFCLTEGYS
jgi:hypothetical protein